MRVGIGYDLHRLVKGRPLFIGGVEIPHSKGLLGHSDGDVLLHAICDALLGAVCEADIGEQFPDNEPRFEGIASTELLIKVYELIRDKGYKLINIDTVIIAEEPKLGVYKKQIQENLARILDLRADCISIKAKTNEGCGETGKKEAVASYAVAMVAKEE
ncbi:MAG: 2-C-methyl-D-erythritol 2,4-cyclodiphosphate synthase [Candidatus Omnitrophica bacterium]|jgi:2-C-methyl-D-erythritol 2,4-cyclodiphosphate synthase|nr:2-C-methyl-D-erythritol 2,4-cyclodiphosphate synthase [Candidatus Omnitrophota bacterium]